jgi:hypothetical protein
MYDSGDMRRWRLPLATLVVVALTALGVRHVSEKRTQQKRDIEYQAALRSYTEVLRPGMSRKEVEDYLRAKNVGFLLMCCVNPKEFSKSVYDELTKVGEEDAGWFCKENNVYVAFQFAGSAHEPGFEADPSDTLRAITIHRSLDGCP